MRETTKLCTACGLVKPLSDYSKGSASFGLKSHCKPCVNKKERARRDSKRAAGIPGNHGRTPRVTCKRCGLPRDGFSITWCRSCCAERKRELYHKHRDKNRLSCVAYRKANIEKERERHRKYRAQNPEKVSAWKANKRARRRMASRGADRVTAAEWAAIKQQQKGRCYYCGKYCGKKSRLTMDHVIPIAAGGKHSAANIVGACLSCNCSKQDKPLPEFARYQGRLFF
jgi:hypothetical protein